MLLAPVEGIHTVKEGDTIPFGGATIQVLHTPGHSPGSVTYRVGDVLFCGDTLFAGSCGRTDFVGELSPDSEVPEAAGLPGGQPPGVPRP